MPATPIRGVSSLRLGHFVTSEFPTFMHNATLFKLLAEAVQFYEDTKNSLIRHLHRGFFTEGILGDDTVLRRMLLKILEVLVEKTDEIHGRDSVFLPVTPLRAHVISLRCIQDTPSEEIGLMVALEFDDELPSVLTPASEVESYAFVE